MAGMASFAGVAHMWDTPGSSGDTNHPPDPMNQSSLKPADSGRDYCMWTL